MKNVLRTAAILIFTLSSFADKIPSKLEDQLIYEANNVKEDEKNLQECKNQLNNLLMVHKFLESTINKNESLLSKTKDEDKKIKLNNLINKSKKDLAPLKDAIKQSMEIVKAHKKYLNDSKSRYEEIKNKINKKDEAKKNQ